MKSLLCFLLVCVCLPPQQPGDWQLAKQADGITIYTTTDPEYAVKGVKAELEFDVPLPQLISLVMDVNRYSAWVYHCKESKLLKQVSKTELIYYHVTDAPWPVDDRDMVSRFVLKKTAASGVELVSGSIDNYLPHKDGFVRVKKTSARWKFTGLASGRVKAEYRLFVDPGGSVPAWMMNLFITDGPYQTFLEMRKRVKEPRYAKARMEDYF